MSTTHHKKVQKDGSKQRLVQLDSKLSIYLEQECLTSTKATRQSLVLTVLEACPPLDHWTPQGDSEWVSSFLTTHQHKKGHSVTTSSRVFRQLVFVLWPNRDKPATHPLHEGVDWRSVNVSTVSE